VILIIAAATAVGLVLRLWQLSRPGYLFGVTEYDDGPYFGSAVRLVDGALPYRDFVLVQPPGIPLLMVPAALAGKPAGPIARAGRGGPGGYRPRLARPGGGRRRGPDPWRMRGRRLRRGEHAEAGRQPGHDRGGRPADPARFLRGHRRGVPAPAGRQVRRPGARMLAGAGRAWHRPGPGGRAAGTVPTTGSVMRENQRSGG
jgi:hypothetical protein